jgi:hypothetical protein
MTDLDRARVRPTTSGGSFWWGINSRSQNQSRVRLSNNVVWGIIGVTMKRRIDMRVSLGIVLSQKYLNACFEGLQRKFVLVPLHL